MIEYTLDEKGNLTGFVDFWIVDEYGNFDNRNKYIWISNWYINPQYRNKGGIAVFIQKVIDKVPWAEYAYFAREKYKNRIRMYHKDKWLKLVDKFRR